VKTNVAKMYFQFYKSTLGINVSFSLFISFLLYFIGKRPIAYSFAIFFMSLGYLFSILIKESSFSNKSVYYFYYNYGITKIKLFIIAGIVNILISIFVIIGYVYAK
jgi:hypothetical protein